LFVVNTHPVYLMLTVDKLTFCDHMENLSHLLYSRVGLLL